MDPFLSDNLQAWRLETRREANGDRCHRSMFGPEYWRPLRHLGNGTFGDVWLEHCLAGPSCNALRAVKHIRKRHADFSKPSRRELEALITFSDTRVPEYQQHFVRCLGWFDDVEHLYIAMEFIQGGDLQQYISKRPFPEVEAALITAQVAQALQYMHQNSFVHRDLKPLNVLVARPGPDWHVKLADFGLAKNTDDTALRTHNVGTQRYMAPELFDDSSGQYTPAVDVWALGALTFCMRSGGPPFRSNKHLFDYVHGKVYFPMRELGTSSGFCLGFVMAAMEVAPERRMTIEQVLGHDWLSMYSGCVEAPGPDLASTMGSSAWDIATHNAWLSTHDNNTATQRPQPPAPAASFKGSPSFHLVQAQTWGGTPAREEPSGEPSRPYLQETRSAPPPVNRAPGELHLPSGQPTIPASPFHDPPRIPMAVPDAPGRENPLFGTRASIYSSAGSVLPEAKPTCLPYPIYASDVPATAYLGQAWDSHQQATVVPPISASPPAQHVSSTSRGTALPIAAGFPIRPGLGKGVLEATMQSQAAAQANPSTHNSWTENDEKMQKIAAFATRPQSSRITTQQERGDGTGYHTPDRPKSPGTSHGGDTDAPLIKDAGRHDPVHGSEEQGDTSNAAPSPETDPFLTCLTCGSSYKERRYLMGHTYVCGHEPQMDSYLTCLTCQLSFGKRSDLFEHLERSGHARDTLTNEPEAYTRPEASRLRDLGEWGGEVGQEEEGQEGKEENELPDPQFTCLTCCETFHNRSDLFEHLERAGHARDSLTNKPVAYMRPEASRLRDLGYWCEEDGPRDRPDPRSTCLTCHETFYNRSDLFEHLERAGHARDILTNEPEAYTRPEGSRLIDLGNWSDEGERRSWSPDQHVEEASPARDPGMNEHRRVHKSLSPSCTCLTCQEFFGDYRNGGVGALEGYERREAGGDPSGGTLRRFKRKLGRIGMKL